MTKRTRRMRTKKMGKSVDLTGMRFGRLTVIKRNGHYVSPNRKQSHSLWLCVCDCGKQTMVRGGQLRNGKTRSCGCLHREKFKRITHNETKTPLYTIWRAMRERCNNPNSISYKWYGAKGIKVCDAWDNSYEAFRDWAVANGYTEGLTIDRMDSNLDYTPDNCRWLTRAENARISAKEMQRRRTNVQKSN